MFLFFTYMYNPLQHVSQRKIGYVNVVDAQHNFLKRKKVVKVR